MTKRLQVCLFCATFFICLTHLQVFAQNKTVISGKITNAANEEPLVGVNVVVKGKVIGTVTNLNGDFRLETNEAPPFTLGISMIGYQSQEVRIEDASTTGLKIALEEQTMLGQEVVVSASRYQENILQSPVTIEKLDIIGIQQATAPDFYDALAHVKGVQVLSSSLTFSAINTRGFASVANTRFVQLIDGMDNSAPLLNFPQPAERFLQLAKVPCRHAHCAPSSLSHRPPRLEMSFSVQGRCGPVGVEPRRIACKRPEGGECDNDTRSPRGLSSCARARRSGDGARPGGAWLAPQRGRRLGREQSGTAGFRRAVRHVLGSLHRLRDCRRWRAGLDLGADGRAGL